MDKNKLNLRNVVAIAICLTAMTMFVSCDKEDNQARNLIVGKWSVTPSYNSIVEITKSNFNFIMGNSETWSYQWISDNSIEIVKPDYTIRSEIIIHTSDSITVKGFWSSATDNNPSENYDAILTRINF